MRDLVALSALPTVWAGYRPLQVAEGLAEVLLSTLRLDVVYLRLPGQTNGQEIEAARTAGGAPSADQTRDIVRALSPWLDGASIDPVLTVLNPVGRGTLHLVVVPIGCGQQSGVLAAASRRPAFPSEEDRLFLTVGANQMAAVLQRLHAEVALRESEERFRGTFENAAVGIAHQDAGGRFLRVNDKYCQTTGYTRDELLQKTWHDITHPEDLAAEREQYARLMRGDLATYSLEKRYIRRDGSPVWIDLAVSLGRDAAAMPTYVIAIVQDISERRQLQEESRAAKESAEAAHARVTRILESITDAFLTLDHDWRFTYINPRAESLLRRSRDELLGKVLWNEFPEAIGSTFERMYQDASATGRPVTFEEYYAPLESWLEVRAYPSADGLSVYFRDMTERRRAEEALRQSEGMFRGTFENAAVGIDHVDLEGRVVRINQKFCEILGYTREDLNTKTWMEFTHPDDLAADLELYGQLLRGERASYSMEKRYIRKDGSIIWVDLTVSLQRDEDGRPAYCIAIVQDTSERKRLEEALRASEAWFRFLADAMPQIVWTARPRLRQHVRPRPTGRS